ncbi:MAG: matrixin family metalloprotease [Longimicrobiales bacterium]
MKKLLLAALLPIGACEGPTVPPNTPADIYDFRLATTPPSVLRWPSGTRVRVHVAGAAGERHDLLSSAFTSGAAEWNRHALYGEYELVRSAGVADADVVLRWSDEPSPVDMSTCPPDLAIAVTTFCLDAEDAARLHRFPPVGPDSAAGNVRFVTTILGTQAGHPMTVERLVVHELGHTLGVARHSLDVQDLMTAGIPTRSTLSARDIATVQILYHTRPQITP